MKVCYGHDHAAWMTHPCHMDLTKTSFWGVCKVENVNFHDSLGVL